jgi:nicotinate-nucleotide adenylyltransferase
LVNQSKPTAAIYGGSFDPPHFGHQHIVEKAIEVLDIDQLIVLPTYLNPFKESSSTSAKKRLEWCHTLFDPIEKVTIDSFETMQGRSVTTFESITHLSNKYNVKYLIIGADNLSSLHKWHEFEWLNNHITWVIATREGYNTKTNGLKESRFLDVSIAVSSTEIKSEHDYSNVDLKIRESEEKNLIGQKNMTNDIKSRVEELVGILDKNKAEEIEVFNLDTTDYIAKQVIIANSLNSKHTIGLHDHVKRELRKKGEEILYSDISDEWVVMDLGDILIHVMVPEYRLRYSLEEFLNELIEEQKKAEK